MKGTCICGKAFYGSTKDDLEGPMLEHMYRAHFDLLKSQCTPEQLHAIKRLYVDKMK